MSKGVFAIARNIFDHEIFSPEPFTEREAWIWLIKEAAWKDRRVRVGDHRVALARGQCACSIRFLADRWGWHRARVERFLKRLKTEAMIETDARQGVSVLTICNYDEYQKVSLPSTDESETPTETGPRQDRDRSETNKNTGENISNTVKEISLTGPAARAGESPEARVYRVGKDVLGKSAGGVITNLRKTCDFDDAVALNWIEQAREKQNPMEWLQAVLRASAPEQRAYDGVIWDGRRPTDVPRIKSREEREWEAREAEIYRGALRVA